MLLRCVGCARREETAQSAGGLQKYIGSLLQVRDFGTNYSRTARLTLRYGFRRLDRLLTRDPVVALVGLGTKGFPLLIDCLEDGRLTIIEFDGNTINEAMKVPVGYVCLDILMGTTRGRPTSDPDRADDGLGACMNDGYYFRPDDYYHCVEPAHSCDVGPWVRVVQRNWQQRFLRRRLHLHNPYDDLKVDVHKDLRILRN